MQNCGRCLIIPSTTILRNFEKKDIFVSLNCAISFVVAFSLWCLFAQALDKCKLGDAVRAKEKKLCSLGKSEKLKERKKKYGVHKPIFLSNQLCTFLANYEIFKEWEPKICTCSNKEWILCSKTVFG